MNNDQLTIGNDQLPEGYKQTAIGLIPEDWKVAQLKDLVDPERKITYGIVVPGSNVPNGVPMIRAQDYSRGWVDLEDLYHVSATIDKSYKRSKVVTADILLTIVGSVGNLAKVPSLFSGSNLTQQTARLAFNTKIADADFYLSILRSRFGQKEISNYTKSGVQPSLNLSDVDKFLLPYPSLPEQRSISQALSDVDALIAGLDKAIAKKRAIKTATMQQLLTGKKRLPEFGEGKGDQQTEVGVIPKDWNVVTIREITSLVTNGFVGKATNHYTDKDDGITYIQGYNVEANSFNFNGIKKVTPEFHRIHQKSCLRKDDLLTIQTGEVGLTTIVPDSLVGANCHALIISRFKKEKAYPWFYAHYFNSPIGRLRLRDLEVGTTMMHINVGELLPWEVPYPPRLEEQRAIATVLSDMDTEIAALETRIAKTQALKQGMMQALLTGRVRLV